MKLHVCILALVTSVMSKPNEQDVLKNGNDQFTAKFLYEVTKSHPRQNIILSPFSVLSPLAQLALASVGPSHFEILKAIGMPTDDLIEQLFFDLNRRLKTVKGVELNLANKVYIHKGYTLNDEFAALSKIVFNSEVQNINFETSFGAAREMNTWVEAHTNKRIKNLVDPSTLSNETAAVLVNAIYFKGSWQTAFNETDTKDEDFFVTKYNKVTIPMMHQSGYFKYGYSYELDAKLLEMYYEGLEMSLIVVLPVHYDGIESLVLKLKDPEAFTKGRNNMFNTKVRVALPKFKIETTTNLKEVLQAMNIKQLFKSDKAHLANLVKGNAKLFISKAIQKAFIEVNEQGTEAAAANAFVAPGISPSMHFSFERFDADHPFVFYLMHQNNILFTGIFRS